MLIKDKPGDKGLQGLGVTGNCRLIRFFFWNNFVLLCILFRKRFYLSFSFLRKQ